MLGKVLRTEPPATKVATVLERLEPSAQGLELCFTAWPEVQRVQERGLFGLVFSDTEGEPQQGELSLLQGQQVRWRLTQGTAGLQLIFVALQSVEGHWQRSAQAHCLRVTLQ